MLMTTICFLSVALVLAACGRKGPLDLPPTASMQPAEDGQTGPGSTAARRPAPPMEIGPDGRPLAPRGPNRQLPLDWLID